ncbi:butyrophilin subfamily 3 member A3-like [Lissotriton helveticus]
MGAGLPGSWLHGRRAVFASGCVLCVCWSACLVALGLPSRGRWISLDGSSRRPARPWSGACCAPAAGVKGGPGSWVGPSFGMMALLCVPRLPPLLLLCLYHQIYVSGAAVQSVEAVGPSQPICDIVGGETIFSCHLNPPVSAVEMEVFWKTEHQIYLVHHYDNGTEYDDKPDEQYKGRTKMIKKDIAQGGVAVSLINLTRSDAGRYMCAFRTRDVDTYAEFELQVAGASACDLEKERDTLQKEKGDLIKARDKLRKKKDTLQKEKGDLIKARDTLQKDKGDLLRKAAKVMVTLDPDTAHPELLLSEGGRRVRRTDTAQRLPDTPKRFTFLYPCVLGSEGFTSGRHYWEVQLLQDGRWEVGVAAESVNRKGFFPWSPEGGVWAVQGTGGRYWALTSPRTPLSPREEPLKLGVYLDYEGGLLSLYNADSMELLFSFPPAPFTQRLFPLFNLWGGAELRLV